ncbi:MAG: signal peptidase II, partial [Lachnospiraceae bacterium]|nr:signal peptidase II [Lachnospiraceae bacterium]
MTLLVLFVRSNFNMNQVKNSNNTFIKAFYMIISLALLFGIDQITKVLAVRFLSDMSVEIIPNFLYLDLLYNKGAAFGILQNQTAFFCITTILICLILELIYFRTPSNKRF